MSLAIHCALFVLVSVAIVTLGTFYSDAEDRTALRNIPRRLGIFIGGCVILAVIVLALEHTFASVS